MQNRNNLFFFSLDCLFCFLLKKIVAQTTRRQIWPIWLCFWPSKCRLLKALNMYCTVTHTLLQIHFKIHGKKFTVWYKTSTTSKIINLHFRFFFSYRKKGIYLATRFRPNNLGNTFAIFWTHIMHNVLLYHINTM